MLDNILKQVGDSLPSVLTALVTLIVGWIIAKIVAWLVGKALRKTGAGAKLVSSFLQTAVLTRAS